MTTLENIVSDFEKIKVPYSRDKEGYPIGHPDAGFPTGRELLWFTSGNHTITMYFDRSGSLIELTVL